MEVIYLSLALFGGVSLVLGLLSRWLRQSLVSETVLALLAGVIAGPLVLDLIDVRDWPESATILEHIALIALAIALMEIALRIPKKELLRHFRSYLLLLGGLMPFMWITSSLLVWLILDIPIWLSLLIGAVITPTDPIVATSIVTGPVAEKYLPERLRDTLWAESGANDGLAYPFVIFPILALEMSLGGALQEFALSSIAYEVIFGALIGAALGFLAGKLLMWSEARHTIDREPFKTFTLALSLTIVGIGTLIGIKTLLAVFIAGIVFHLTVGEKEDRAVEEVQGAIDQFFTLPVFTLIGIAIPVGAWLDLGWPALLLVVSVLLLRRIPGMLILYRWVGTLHSRSDALFVGWFGPIGIGALFYASFAIGQGAFEEVWIVGSLIIVASVVLHGATALPFSRLYAHVQDVETDSDEDTDNIHEVEN